MRGGGRQRGQMWHPLWRRLSYRKESDRISKEDRFALNSVGTERPSCHSDRSQDLSLWGKLEPHRVTAEASAGGLVRRGAATAWLAEVVLMNARLCTMPSLLFGFKKVSRNRTQDSHEM